MESVFQEMEFFQVLSRNLGIQFGTNCEIVLHDFTQEKLDSTIVAVTNGHVTGRSLGDGPTSLFFRYFKDGMHEDIEPYINCTDDGRIFKSSTTLIKNSEGKVIGSLCINMDITALKMMENSIQKFCSLDSQPLVEEHFPNKVSELLEQMLEECTLRIGKPPQTMSREEKIQAIRYLDQKGIFLITKSGKRVCSYFQISKYTFYNYLDEARGIAEKKPAP